MSLLDIFRLRKTEPQKKVLSEEEEELLEEGIERRIQRKQNQAEESEEEEIELVPDYEDKEQEYDFKDATTDDYMKVILDNCEQIVDSEKQNQYAKIEYQAVTEYLSDLQRIERMDKDDKKQLLDAAKKVDNLTKERENYQQKEIHTSNPRFRPIQTYEKIVMEDLRRMREQEDYGRKVKNDLKQLTAEKKSLKYEYSQVIQRQQGLKKIGVALFAIVISLFVLFLVLTVGSEQSMVIPYSMTILMAAGMAGYIFLQSYRNRYEHALLEKKINRAIELTNKVKIKYINNTSTLDYSNSKYNVENSMELEYLVKEYMKAKEQERTYQSNTERLDHYRNKLIEILQKQKVKDAEIWIYQVQALLEPVEFGGIKSNLEERRERLIEKMNYNLQLKDDCFMQLHQIIERDSSMREEVMKQLAKYNITI